MFDFAWSQIALIAVVALIAIGPKDMPVAIRAITGAIKKARRMAGEFQTHVDEMMREANLDEVKNQFNDLRSFDFRKEIEKAVDPDGSIRDTFASDPLNPTPLPEVTVPEATPPSIDTADAAEPAQAEAVEPQKPSAPAFIPPNMVPPADLAAASAEAEVPSFIPPAFVRQSNVKG